MRRFTALVLLLILPLAACHKWAPLEFRPGVEPDTTVTKSQVRASRTDGVSLVIYEARVTADSVTGYDQPFVSGTQRNRIALPRNLVEEIEVRRSDPLGTTLTVLGVAVGAFVIGFSIVCAASDDCLNFYASDNDFSS